VIILGPKEGRLKRGKKLSNSRVFLEKGRYRWVSRLGGGGRTKEKTRGGGGKGGASFPEGPINGDRGTGGEGKQIFAERKEGVKKGPEKKREELQSDMCRGIPLRKETLA